jgi:hypothetical protein
MTVTATGVLVCLTILSKVHVTILHFFIVSPALDNLTFWDKIALQYSRDIVLAGSTGFGLFSST